MVLPGPWKGASGILPECDLLRDRGGLHFTSNPFFSNVRRSTKALPGCGSALPVPFETKKNHDPFLSTTPHPSPKRLILFQLACEKLVEILWKLANILQDIDSLSLTATMGWGRVSVVPYVRRLVGHAHRDIGNFSPEANVSLRFFASFGDETTVIARQAGYGSISSGSRS